MTADERVLLQRRIELVNLLERDGAVATRAVRQALLDVPRHRFIPLENRHQAYENCALPIGLGQTISQPHMVAVMTELLHPGPDKTILEIGTGSGYQAAVLSRLCRAVHTVERIPELARRAEEAFRELGYDNIVTRVGDGTAGWPEFAPYDGIIVTAGAPAVPESLRRQLKDGGSLVIPVGDRSFQMLRRQVRHGDTFREEEHGGCIFVRLVGAEGWPEEREG
jgi:protein-L-isoaspartate(D-aspartate) O-methyltransferase